MPPKPKSTKKSNYSLYPMLARLRSKRGFLILAAVIMVAAAVIWAVQYFGLLAKDRFNQGPVVVRPTAPKPNSVPYQVKEVTTGLNVPWDMVFTSGNRILVSERSGTIRVIEQGKLVAEPLLRITEVSNVSEEGLMGLALDPDYTTNKLVYACYAYATRDGLRDRVIKFEDRDNATGPIMTVIDNIPAAQYHAGCRLSFGPQDKKLYITTGDATDKNIAQQLSSLGGKILRVNSDGSIPSDNPFSGSPVWSLGHRNPQGTAWQPETNQLFSTEHGPSGFDGAAGGDEVNIITKGGNYGWPVVSHQRTDTRFISPLLVFTPAVAPSGATFYSSDVLPQFKGDLFFTGLRGEGLYRIELTGSERNQVARYEKLSDVNYGRLRDVAAGPDGSIYFVTSNRDGRGQPRAGDDKLLRISPKE